MDNQQRFFFAQRDTIEELFQQTDDNDDEAWERLTDLLDSALINPFLPRLFRAEYNAIRALNSSLPEEYIEAAEEAMVSIREIRAVEIQEGTRAEEQADQGLTVVLGLIEAAKDYAMDLKEALEAEEAHMDDGNAEEEGLTAVEGLTASEGGPEAVEEGEPAAVEEGGLAAEAPAPTAASRGVKRKRTREVTPIADLLPTPPGTREHRRKQPARRVKSK